MSVVGYRVIIVKRKDKNERQKDRTSQDAC
jgi:hypothetical protein